MVLASHPFDEFSHAWTNGFGDFTSNISKRPKPWVMPRILGLYHFMLLITIVIIFLPSALHCPVVVRLLSGILLLLNLISLPPVLLLMLVSFHVSHICMIFLLAFIFITLGLPNLGPSSFIHHFPPMWYFLLFYSWFNCFHF